MTGELPLENVEAIYLSEPLFGRLLGYGTVLVTSLGGHYIASPQAFHAMLQKAVGGAKSSAKRISKAPTPPPDDDSRYMPKG